MSKITEILLLADEGESSPQKDSPNVQKIQTWLKDNCEGQQLKRIDTFDSKLIDGGHRLYATPTYLSAINHIDMQAFTKFLKGLPQDNEHMDSMQLLYKDEESSKFELVNVFIDDF